MTSLLERERMAGQAQLIYIDPPYGINFNSNFQARISNRAPKETDEATITREPEQIQAYRDTWQLGSTATSLTYASAWSSRASYWRTGSVMVQIGPDNMHLVRMLLDEVFGADNHCATITVTKTSQATAPLLPEVTDFLLWYAKDKLRSSTTSCMSRRNLDLRGGLHYRGSRKATRKLRPRSLASPVGGHTATVAPHFRVSDLPRRAIAPQDVDLRI